MSKYNDPLSKDLLDIGFKDIGGVLSAKANKKDIENVSKAIARDICKGNKHIIWLEGDLGAGKTFFVKNLSIHLGCNINVKSPSFNKINLYNFGESNTLCHIDLYLAKDEQIVEILDISSDCIVSCFEWANLFKNKISKPTIIINLQYLEETDWRTVSVTIDSKK